jgi:hypothetical protein
MHGHPGTQQDLPEKNGNADGEFVPLDFQLARLDLDAAQPTFRIEIPWHASWQHIRVVSPRPGLDLDEV